VGARGARDLGVRDDSFLHTVGLGFVVGANVAIDLRILSVAREMPLVLWIGVMYWGRMLTFFQ